MNELHSLMIGVMKEGKVCTVLYLDFFSNSLSIFFIKELAIQIYCYNKGKKKTVLY